MTGDASNRRVRVLVNGLHAHSGGGVTYLRNMLPLLAGDEELELHLSLHRHQGDLFSPVDSRVRVHFAGFTDGFYRRLVWEQTALPLLARRLGVDVTFSPANFGPLLAPAPVVLLRNALAVAETETRPSKRLYWAALGAMTTASLWRCPAAIAVSAYAREALTRRLPQRIRSRIEVVHHGVGTVFSPPEPGRRRENFLLAVSDIYIQKNLHRLLMAVDELRTRIPDVHLKIAGSPIDAEYARSLQGMIAGRGLEAHVELLGRLSSDALADLYRRCALFVFPSLAETFGNPLLEAMACGAPVVSSRATAMPEVLGDAAVFFDPLDVEGMGAAIGSVLGDGDLRRRLGEKALARAQAFSWETTAQRTAGVIKRCAGIRA